MKNDNNIFSIFHHNDNKFVEDDELFINNKMQIAMKFNGEFLKIDFMDIYINSGILDKFNNKIINDFSIVEIEMKQKIRGTKKKDRRFIGVFKYNNIDKCLEIHFKNKFWHYESNIIKYHEIRKYIHCMKIVGIQS